MNKAASAKQRQPKPRHGSYGSYITGFVLSLLFTLIPYYLVVDKKFTGNFLVAIILGFAFMQLIIQVVFFLHLGRERGPRFNTVFLMATVGAVFVVVAGSVWIMTHLQANMPTMDVTMKLSDDENISQVGGIKTGGCEGTNVNHNVFIRDGIAISNHVTAHICDSLTFTNDDKTSHDITFGSLSQQVPYAGNIDQTLYTGRSWTIILSQQGTYNYFDSKHPATNGTFTVTQ